MVHQKSPLARHPRTTHILLQNEIPLSETLAQLDAANDPSLPAPLSTMFNPSPMPTKEQLIAFPWDKLTWLIVNEGEASDMNKVLAPAGDVSVPTFDKDAPYASLSAYPILLRLSQCIPATNIVCTLGGAGVLAYVPCLQAPPVFLPAAKLQGTVRDTTGAGDCFTGYLVAGLMQLDGPLTPQSLVQVLRRCVQVLSASPLRLFNDSSLLTGSWYVCRESRGNGEYSQRQRCRCAPLGYRKQVV